MEKKEFPKRPLNNTKNSGRQDAASFGNEGIKPKLSGLADKLFSVVKLILGLCFLAFVYSSTVSLSAECKVIDTAVMSFFLVGIAVFVIIHLFVFEAAEIYRRGQKLLEIVFKFFSPFVKIASFLLPIYALVIFFVYWPLSYAIRSVIALNYFMFLFGFAMAFHLVFSAKILRSRQGDFLKSHYIFGFSFVYIVNIVVIALCFNLIFADFSFVNFFNNAFKVTGEIVFAVFSQLFIPQR
jgi:hypothetical protein